MTKEYCEFQCELQTREKKINERITLMINALTTEILRENEDVHSACVKRLIGDILKVHGDIIHIELIEEYKKSHNLNNKPNQKYSESI